MGIEVGKLNAFNPNGYLAQGYKSALGIGGGRPSNDSYDVNANKQRFSEYIDLSQYSGDERKFAEEYVGKKVTSEWNPGWFESQGVEFEKAMSKYRLNKDTNRARDRFEEITDTNSKYNQDIYNRLDRMNTPDNYEGSLLNRAMGLGAKSSAFLAKKGYEQQEAKGKENTYNQFSDLKTRSEGTALGYLDLASGKESFLTKLMSDESMQLKALSQQKSIEESQRKSQFYNSIIKTVLGGGIALATGGVGGKSLFVDGMKDIYDYSSEPTSLGNL